MTREAIEKAIRERAENVSHAPNAHSRHKVLNEMRSLVDAVLRQRDAEWCEMLGYEPAGAPGNTPTFMRREMELQEQESWASVRKTTRDAVLEEAAKALCDDCKIGCPVEVDEDGSMWHAAGTATCRCGAEGVRALGFLKKSSKKGADLINSD